MLYGDFKRKQMHNSVNIKTVEGIPPLQLLKSKGKPLKDYKIYGNSYQKLPQEYQEVEYIESTGTQYIDTRYKIDDTCGYKIDVSILDSIDSIELGVKGTGDSRWCLNSYSYIYISWNTYVNIVQVDTDRHIIQMNYKNDRKRIVDDIEYRPITQTLNPSASNYNVLLFAAHWGSNSVSLYGSARIYSCQITKGSNIVRDFIPCYRKADNEIGLYDTVTNTFFTNQGTGTFAKGSDVIPTPDNPIEIESVGDLLLPKEYQEVEYINLEEGSYTSLDVSSTTAQTVGVKLDFQMNKEYKSTSAYVFGCYNYDVALTAGVYRGVFYSSSGNMTYNKSNITDRCIATGSALGRVQNLSLGGRYNSSGVVGVFSDAKIFSCIVTIDNIEVRSLVPCYRKSDNEVGMYDLVEDKFYTNQGTGTFTKGSDVNHYKIPIEVKTKNIFNERNFINSIWTYNNTEKAYTGLCSRISYKQADPFIYDFKPNTQYTISLTSKYTETNNGIVIFIAYTDETRSRCNCYTTTIGTYKSFEFTSEANKTIESIYFSYSTETTAYIKNFQLEESSTATPYVPYFNETANIILNEPLRKIGDYADYIDFKNQKVVRNIQERYVRQIASSNWTKSSSYPGGFYTGKGSVSPQGKWDRQTQFGFLCNYAPSVKSVDEYSVGTCFEDGSYNFRFFNSTTMPTIADWVNYINTHDVKMYYVATSPVIESIALPPILTAKGDNTLDINTKILPSNVIIKYIK